MAEQTSLRPELREQMGDWVMGYVHRRKRLRRRLTVAGVSFAVGAAVIGVSAWVALAPQSVVDRHVTCFEHPTLSSRSIESVLSDSGSVHDPAANAVSLCEDLWRVGGLHVGGPVANSGGDVYAVPSLTLCARTNGTYTVFPRPADPVTPAAFCDSLGLVPVPGH